MLLRSSSAPILNSNNLPKNSRFKNQKSSLKEEEEDQPNLQLHRTTSLSSSASILMSTSPRHNKPSRNSDARVFHTPGGSGIDGSGGGGGDVGESTGKDSGDEIEAYYLRMIEANPRNSLILGNYAKFLKEVRGDYDKAEEYCRRAILANPNDAVSLVLFADLILITQNDYERAETYFDRAVKASPHDSYVLASYARFLWDEEEREHDEDRQSLCWIDLDMIYKSLSIYIYAVSL